MKISSKALDQVKIAFPVILRGDWSGSQFIVTPTGWVRTVDAKKRGLEEFIEIIEDETWTRENFALYGFKFAGASKSYKRSQLNSIPSGDEPVFVWILYSEGQEAFNRISSRVGCGTLAQLHATTKPRAGYIPWRAVKLFCFENEDVARAWATLTIANEAAIGTVSTDTFNKNGYRNSFMVVDDGTIEGSPEYLFKINERKYRLA